MIDFNICTNYSPTIITCLCGQVVSKTHSSILILICLWTSVKVLTANDEQKMVKILFPIAAFWNYFSKWNLIQQIKNCGLVVTKWYKFMNMCKVRNKFMRDFLILISNCTRFRIFIFKGVRIVDTIIPLIYLRPRVVSLSYGLVRQFEFVRKYSTWFLRSFCQAIGYVRSNRSQREMSTVFYFWMKGICGLLIVVSICMNKKVLSVTC